MSIEPGWYKDPAEPTTQRYWDGEGWLGEPLPVDATPPPGPPPAAPPPPPPPAAQPSVAPPGVAGPPVVPQGVAGPPIGGPPPGYPTWQVPPGQIPPGQIPPGHYPPGTQFPPGYPYPAVQPEPKPHGFQLATPWARLGARVVDVLLVLLLNAIGNGWFVYQYIQDVTPYYRELVRRTTTADLTTAPMPALPDGLDALTITIIFVALAIWFAYEVPATGNSGQTVGKRLFGVKVMRLENAEPLGMGRSTRRWLRMGWPALLWPCYGIGLILQLLDSLFVLIDRPLRQTIHDKIALTVVVRVPRPATQDRALTRDQPEDGADNEPSHPR